MLLVEFTVLTALLEVVGSWFMVQRSISDQRRLSRHQPSPITDHRTCKHSALKIGRSTEDNNDDGGRNTYIAISQSKPVDIPAVDSQFDISW
eukprot:scaffold231352_cov60-Cyclotella_meneghiniana.AAC.1